MKKIILAAIIVSICSTLNIFAQQKNTIISVDGNIIKLVAPNKDYHEVGLENHITFKSLVNEESNLFAVYLNDSDYKILTNNDTTSYALVDYMLVENTKEFDTTNYSEADFSSLIERIITDTKCDVPLLVARADDAIKDIDAGLIKGDDAENKTLGCLFSTTNACGSLMLVTVKENSKYQHSLCAANYVRIKNRLLFVFIFSNYEGFKSIKWIKELSESWSKAIIDANK